MDGFLLVVEDKVSIRASGSWKIGGSNLYWYHVTDASIPKSRHPEHRQFFLCQRTVVSSIFT
jgi:hypothetical protein